MSGPHKYFCEEKTCLMKFRKWGPCAQHLLESGHGVNNKATQQRSKIRNYPSSLGSPKQNLTDKKVEEGFMFDIHSISDVDLGLPLTFSANSTPTKSTPHSTPTKSSTSITTSPFKAPTKSPNSSPLSSPSAPPAWALAEAELLVSMALRKPLPASEITRRAKKQHVKPHSEYVRCVLAAMNSDPRVMTEMKQGNLVWTRSRAYSTSNDNAWTIGYDPISPKQKSNTPSRPSSRSQPQSPQSQSPFSKASKNFSSKPQAISTTNALASVPSYFEQVRRPEPDTDEDYTDKEDEEKSEDSNGVENTKKGSHTRGSSEGDDEAGVTTESEDSGYQSDDFGNKRRDKSESECVSEEPKISEEEKLSIARDSAVSKLMFGRNKVRDVKAVKKLERGFSIADRASSKRFAEAAYFGRISECEVVEEDGAAVDLGENEIYLNTHEPFCLAAVGVQGAGKSHTMAVVLESCLIPCPYPTDQELIRLQRPMTALVLHYDQNVTSVCEATGLISALPALQQAFKNQPIAVPRDKMIVLVSPSYYLQRKQFYGDYCIVKPLLFSWANLTADHIKKIMRINEGDNQLYVAMMLDLLRSYQRGAVVPEFQGFLNQVREICNIKTQAAPLLQRISLLEAFVAESVTNASIISEGADLYSTIGPGCLVVADLTDPLLSSQEANGIFQVLTEQFRTVPSPDGCGKLLALDEAHKFMDGVGNDGLSNAIVNAARLMRHDGMRVIVSSQSPKALAPELLELVSIAVMHRFHSRDWFDYLRSKIPLDNSVFDKIVDLTPGSALVFATRHLVAGQNDLVMDVDVRARLTVDRGSSRTNLVNPKK